MDARTEASQAKVCIIGAGPAGLAMARALHHRQIKYDQFDAHSDVGGVWDIDQDGSAVYESAHLITSRKLSGYTGFPMPNDYPDYPSHSQVLKYLRSFADEYDLKDGIEFLTRVVNIEKLIDDTWKVTLQNGDVRDYRAVVCATGSQWHPKMPELSGNFDGEIRHSNTYRSGKEFEGKRVLVVGAGNSGCDIACDASTYAEEAFLSLRRGYYFVPKHVFGMPADEFASTGPKLPIWLARPILTTILRLLVGDVTKYGLRKPDHRLLETHPILNSQIIHAFQHGLLTPKQDVSRLDGREVVFEDGTREEIDLILCATGFNQVESYADGYFDYAGTRPKLFMQAFSSKHKNLFAISYVETNSSAFGLYDMMALAIASYIQDQLHVPERATEFGRLIAGPEPDLSGGIKFDASERHGGYFDSDAYKGHMRKLYRKMTWPLPEQEFA